MFHRRYFYSPYDLSLKPCKCCQRRIKAKGNPPHPRPALQVRVRSTTYLLIEQTFEDLLCAPTLNKTSSPTCNTTRQDGRQVSLPTGKSGDRFPPGGWSVEAGHSHQITDRSEEMVLARGGFPRRMRCQPSGKCRELERTQRGAGVSKRYVGSSESNLVTYRYFDSLNLCILKIMLSSLSVL